MTGIFAEITNNIKIKTSLNDKYPSWFIYVTHEEEIRGFSNNGFNEHRLYV